MSLSVVVAGVNWKLKRMDIHQINNTVVLWGKIICPFIGLFFMYSHLSYYFGNY